MLCINTKSRKCVRSVPTWFPWSLPVRGEAVSSRLGNSVGRASLLVSTASVSVSPCAPAAELWLSDFRQARDLYVGVWYLHEVQFGF